MSSSSRQHVVALVAIDPQIGPQGWPSAIHAPLADTTVLGMMLRRLSRCDELDGMIAIATGDGRDEIQPIVEAEARRSFNWHLVEGPVFDERHARRIAARKWSPAAWRGGLGGMTCYDEWLSPAAMLAALEAADADAGMIVGADWPLIDPQLCAKIIRRHREYPDQLRLTFTQAPPGLCGFLLERNLLAQMVEKNQTIGWLLEYHPQAPQPDPIARETCVQIEPAIRNGALRATCDAPRWRRLVDHVTQGASAEQLLRMDALQTIQALTEAQRKLPSSGPQQVTVELTTHRPCTGPITPQHHVTLERGDLSVEHAAQLFEQLAGAPDVAVTLGGLGDALVHPDWLKVVEAAREAGIWGIAVETDLVTDEQTLGQLAGAPVDVVSVRMNADTAETYERLMGRSDLRAVMDRIDWLVRHTQPNGLPWAVPRMIKTRDNVTELETFFDRGVFFCGHAVIDPPSTGCSLMPDQSVIDMAPPQRTVCRQLHRRMTVHADGRIALCDQDWLGRHCLGELSNGNGGEAVATAWGKLDEVRRAHQDEQWQSLPLCAACRQWHRP
jgi:spiro-SPASM protein